ncbi:MAG: hypothetical protein ACRENM_02790 [Candidatus Dormibacteraceae bacterium]
MIDSTSAGEMSWTALPTEGENTFIHLLPDGAGSLVVRRLYSTYQLALRNAHGEQLESLGEMQKVHGVVTLWHLIDAARQPPADAYAALERDLGLQLPPAD